jgi:bifunctional non-homologous end joining protein LigD
MLLRSRPDPLGFIEPCAPVLYEVAPAGPDWLHEIKHDGWRIIARKNGARVRLWTRNGRDWTADFPDIATAIAHLPNDRMVLDGEAVGHTPDDPPDFHALQSPKGRCEAVLYAIDLLILDGRDLRPEPLALRRDLLAETLYDPLGGLALSEAVEGEGATILRHACKLGLEGIVSKRRSARYRSGRDHAWRKIKCSGYRCRAGSTAE